MEAATGLFSQFQVSVPAMPVEMDLKLIDDGPPPKPTNLEAVADGNSLFSGDLHCALIEEIKSKLPNRNMVFSPLSLSCVMGMTKLGARGQTRREIENVLHFPRDSKELCKGYAEALMSIKEANGGYTLSIGNTLYRQKGYSLFKEFREAIENSFGSPVQQVKMLNEVDAAEQINSWVEEASKPDPEAEAGSGPGPGQEPSPAGESEAKTEAPAAAAKTAGAGEEEVGDADAEPKIPTKVLNVSYSLISSNKLNFVNGVYFKGEWEKKFDSKKTGKVRFFLGAKKCQQVDMMHTKLGIIPFVEIEELDVKVVALPYIGDRICMLIYLPRQRTGLAKLEDQLKTTPASKILQQLKSLKLNEVEVWLPRFKIESELSLIEPLQKLGINALFGTADFSGISLESVSVAQVAQKTFIQVHEGGTDVGPPKPIKIPFVSSILNMFTPAVIQFKVEHPFAFQIVDKGTNFVMFAGSCNNPNK